ncbi:MAG: exopolyphosphatase [Deltaproteobacteria bacterium HGW-Deltaproteobacteria-4]|nr:MAG: exopolyphosphatase [Deltaproteobacteria bacterium HGW-Deltaproteobacteria-4]
MKAAIDIGSNSVRLLLGEVVGEQVVPHQYFRHITRLAGGYDPQSGLAAAARARTLSALEAFAQLLDQTKPVCTRAVATEAVRRAVNGEQFVADVLAHTGISVEIINGDEEAALSSAGVLSGLQPPPLEALIFDIGGGSTELIVIKDRQRLWQKSYPLGVVSLAETPNPELVIAEMLAVLADDLRVAGFHSLLAGADCELVGTAGTVTTLAAFDLAMTEYDWQRINNYLLSRSALLSLYQRLLPLSAAERELLPGIEKGRGDLIVHGADIVLALMQLLDKDELRISDFGLLEGTLLSM